MRLYETYLASVELEAVDAAWLGGGESTSPSDPRPDCGEAGDDTSLAASPPTDGRVTDQAKREKVGGSVFAWVNSESWRGGM